MKKKDDILAHLEYGLKHVDGLCWLCQLLTDGVAPKKVEVRFDGKRVISKASLSFLQNPLAEAGLIYCRKLLEFLGIKLDRKTGTVLREVTSDRTGDDVGVEHLGLDRISLDELRSAAGFPAAEIEAACIHTIRAGNKGVAHFTVDEGERAQAEQVIVAATVVLRLIEANVYGPLSLPVPTYKVWTAD